MYLIFEMWPAPKRQAGIPSLAASRDGLTHGQETRAYHAHMRNRRLLGDREYGLVQAVERTNANAGRAVISSSLVGMT